MAKGIVWKIRKDAESQGSSDGFWYDLTDGGYIDLSLFIADKDQLKTAKDAVETLHSLQKTLENACLLNEF